MCVCDVCVSDVCVCECDECEGGQAGGGRTEDGADTALKTKNTRQCGEQEQPSYVQHL